MIIYYLQKFALKILVCFSLLNLSNMFPFTGGDFSKSTLFICLFLRFANMKHNEVMFKMQQTNHEIKNTHTHTQKQKQGTLREITPSKWKHIAQIQQTKAN